MINFGNKLVPRSFRIYTSSSFSLLPVGLSSSSFSSCSFSSSSSSSSASAAAAAAPSESVIRQIDLRKFVHGSPAERQAVVNDWSWSFETVGFATITNYQYPSESTRKSLEQSAREFFSLSDQEKLRSCTKMGYGLGGYTPPGVEAVGRTRAEGRAPCGAEDEDEDGPGKDQDDTEGGCALAPPDLVESFSYIGNVSDLISVQQDDVQDNQSNINSDNNNNNNNNNVNSNNNIISVPSPQQPASFVQDCTNYWQEAEQLLSILMKLTAASLKLSEDFFTPFFSPPHNVLRLAHYPALSASFTPEPGQLRYGAHTDYTGFTILLPDQHQGGLEVQLESGEWVQLDPPPDCLIVNAGDLFPRWTNNKWKSAFHRVGFGDTSHDRLSIVFFTGPNNDAVIEVLDSCYNDTDSPKLYKPITAGEHLRQQIERSNTSTSSP